MLVCFDGFFLIKAFSLSFIKNEKTPTKNSKQISFEYLQFEKKLPKFWQGFHSQNKLAVSKPVTKDKKTKFSRGMWSSVLMLDSAVSRAPRASHHSQKCEAVWESEMLYNADKI